MLRQPSDRLRSEEADDRPIVEDLRLAVQQLVRGAKECDAERRAARRAILGQKNTGSR
jgi:hypothetical protein